MGSDAVVIDPSGSLRTVTIAKAMAEASKHYGYGPICYSFKKHAQSGKGAHIAPRRNVLRPSEATADR